MLVAVVGCGLFCVRVVVSVWGWVGVWWKVVWNGGLWLLCWLEK